ncbi:AAA family ATPase [Corynebacterium macginleyi]|uniref:AAA family ATPase n=1 Tax=Corynebacterium macginleyi TaxID=38290 RepID=UPI00190DB712|nr:AAA family ATPase [Corynebacterium macginleyi]MBK4148037.1 AAA family ATPase [Corynebacterium macginleyi]MBK4159461.1 AAA family ATPase [Corynebacterium macginleyi]
MTNTMVPHNPESTESKTVGKVRKLTKHERQSLNDKYRKDLNETLKKLGFENRTDVLDDGTYRNALVAPGGDEQALCQSLYGGYDVLSPVGFTNAKTGEVVHFKAGEHVDAIELYAGVHGMTPDEYGRVLLDNELARERVEATKRERARLEAREAAEQERIEQRALRLGITPGDGWQGNDDAYNDVLTMLASGALEQPTAEVVYRSDHVGMFYLGCTHTVFGEPGVGKSWVAQFSCAEQLKRGGHVLYLDYESNFRQVAQRLYNLGVPVDAMRERLTYRGATGDPANPGTTLEHPHTPHDGNTMAEAVYTKFTELIDRHPYTLAVIDGVASAMSAGGYDNNSNDDAVTFSRELPEFIANHSGAAVLMVDHVTKAAGNRRYAMGAGQKLARVTGVSFRADAIDTDDPDAHRLALYVTKDRNDAVLSKSELTPEGHLFGHFVWQRGTVLTKNDNHVVAGIENPATARAWEKRETAKVLAADATDIDQAVSAAGLSQPDTIAVLLAYLGQGEAMTVEQLRTRTKNDAPLFFERLNGNFTPRLNRARGGKDKAVISLGGNGSRIKANTDVFTEDMAALLHRLQAPTDDAEADQNTA